MLQGAFYGSSLNVRLIIIMLFLSFIMITALLIIYSSSERALSREIERQTADLTKAIQIGVEEVTASGLTDEARLANYLKELNTRGIKEITIISNADEIVASTIPSKIGQPLTHKRKELIIKAELGEPVSEEGSAYNVILPVIAGNTQYGYIHLKVNKDDLNKIMKENTLKRITAAIIVFGIGIVLTVILSNHYTKPIKQIADSAVRVAAGDLNQHISVKGNDEIAMMAESFNHMVSKLREMRLLEERLREAEHLSALGQLSRTIAHEIRNPLNFINLSIEHMETKYVPTNGVEREKFLDITKGIKQEVKRLNRLVGEVLDFSRPIKLNLKTVHTKDLLDDIIALIWAKAEAEQIQIKRHDTEEAELSIDVELFKSCLMNVITNSFQAMAEVAPEHRTLLIKTEREGGYFVFSIIDSGIGIEPALIDKIFEPFFSTKEGGLGLGLSMTKRVIEEHGGSIEVFSTKDKGTEVRILLPIKVKDITCEEPVQIPLDTFQESKLLVH